MKSGAVPKSELRATILLLIVRFEVAPKTAPPTLPVARFPVSVLWLMRMAPPVWTKMAPPLASVPAVELPENVLWLTVTF